MPRTLLYRQCPSPSNGDTTTEVFYDTAARGEVRENPTRSYCEPFHLESGTLLDSWCEGTTKVEIKAGWNGTGRPPRPSYEKTLTANAASCSVSVCGLKVDDVQLVQQGGTYTATVFASGYDGAIEYSLNQFIDVQDSNVFEGLGEGSYTAYVRAKR